MKITAVAWLVLAVPASTLPLGWEGVFHGAFPIPPSRPVFPRDDRTVVTDPQTGRILVPGETSRSRTIYVVVSLFCAVVLAFLFGMRAKVLRNNVTRKVNFTSILVVFLFFFALGFIFCASVVESGQSLRTHKLCYSAAMICLVFYTGNKLTIYVFLLERARIVRAPFMPRTRDWLWITGMIIICGGFGTIAIVGYLNPIVELSKLDAKCRMGLPSKVSFPLMCFDVGVNFLLTGVFIWLLKPMLAHHGLLSLSGLFGSGTVKKRREARERDRVARYTCEQLQAINRDIRILLWKCLIGSTLVMLPTVGNMAQFYVMKGRELGWICLTICTLDVSWGVIIVNWLTVGSARAEKNLTTLVSPPTTYGGEERPVTPTVSNERSNSFTVGQPPVVLQDAGKLLEVDNAVSPVKRMQHA